MQASPETSSSAETVSSVISGVLHAQGGPSVTPGESLRDAGVTSLQLVNIMLALEDAFGLTFPKDKLTPRNFRSIETIEALVSGLLQPS